MWLKRAEEVFMLAGLHLKCQSRRASSHRHGDVVAVQVKDEFFHTWH
uniref:Uncharacterized protein n=1 Tax=Anguilla anguilla TaxID=7936 RepID=A0A0E9Q054_ANGAN